MRGGTTKANFREARRHEHELNERQREVLALVAQGLTNAEIGERLGMSLDGAKWNVSEILSKLGLASREEAAEYWRWRHEGVWSRVRALLGAPLARVIGAGAVAVVGAGAVVAMMSDDEPQSEDVPGRPFYLEAEVHVLSNARSIGTNVAGGSNPGEAEESNGVMRWWWQDSDHFRFEYETREPLIESGTTAVVGDGETQWVSRDGAFSRAPLEPLPDGYEVRPMTFSLFIGPMPLADSVDTVDEFIEAFTGWRNDGSGWARMVGEETYLGRQVSVVEMGPLGCSGGGTDSNGQTTPEECYGVSRLWVDSATMLVLKHVGDDEGHGAQSFEARVTRLDYDVEHPRDRFKFEPPPGARENGDGSLSGWASTTLSGDGQSADVPAGFFEPRLLPENYRYVGVEQSGGSVASGVELTLEGPQGEKLTIAQRRRAIPDELRAGDVGTLRGGEVYSTRLENGWTRAAFERAGITVVIESEALLAEQLLAIAGSMEIVD